MNKEYDYIRGNTALAPKRREDLREKELEKKRKRFAQKKQLKKQNAKRAKDILVTSLIMAALGAITIGVNNHVYQMQRSLSVIESGISTEKDTNEAIKVDLLQFASLNNINDAASKQLGMVYPNKENTINVDMSKEYFGHINGKKANDQGLIAKAMGIFGGE